MKGGLPGIEINLFGDWEGQLRGNTAPVGVGCFCCGTSGLNKGWGPQRNRVGEGLGVLTALGCVRSRESVVNGSGRGWTGLE